MEYLIILDTKMKAMIPILGFLDLILQLLLKGLALEYLEEKLEVKELARITELMLKNVKNTCKKNSHWRFLKYEYR